MKHLAIYFGRPNWSRQNVEKGVIFETIEQLEAWMATTTTYCNPGRPCLQLNPSSREKVENWLAQPDKPFYFKTTNCGCWDILLTTTNCDSFDEYKQQRDEAAKQKAQAREQKRLAELYEPRKGWYGVNLELSGDGITTHPNSCKDFTGKVIADNGAEAYKKAVSECQAMAPGYSPAGMLSSGYSFEFLGVKTDDGYSVELWQQWKNEGTI